MLFLLFELGQERYALDVGQIAEVLPLVRVKPVLQAPPGVAGLFNYRGTPVPVVDLSDLALGQPAPARLSTRLILVHYPDGHGRTRLLGLIAEHATDMIRREAADFDASGIGHRAAAFVGRVTNDERGLIEWLDINTLLPASLRDVLFADTVGG